MAQRSPAATAARPSAIRARGRRCAAISGAASGSDSRSASISASPAASRARCAGDGDGVARPGRVAAQQRAAVARAPDRGRAEAGARRARDVAARDPRAEAAAGRGQPVHERIEVCERDVGPELRRDQQRAGLGAHRREVGEAGRGAAPADIGQRHRVASPVRALDEAVDGRDGDGALVRPRRGVVAGRHEDVVRGGLAEALDDALDQPELTEVAEAHGACSRAALRRPAGAAPATPRSPRSSRRRRLRGSRVPAPCAGPAIGE